MSSSASQHHTARLPDADPTTLGRALGQNEAAQEAIEQSASELAIINAVLQQELPEHVQSDDIAMALEKNDALESRIQETAQDLAEVNEALGQEITERVKLEQELQAAKDALAEATGKASGETPAA
jgi:C4-dicarboxylate-specific signal transduction histidine kinase